MSILFDIPGPASPEDIALVTHTHAARLWRAGHATLRESPWSSSSILAWSEWTHALWAQLLLAGQDDRVLLNSLQEHALWIEVIAVHPPPGALAPGSVPELARLAHSGFERAASFELPGQLGAAADTTDARLFADWAEAFRSRCEQDRLLPAALLLRALGDHLRAGHWSPPPALHMVAFPVQSPAQARFLEILERSGCRLLWHRPPSRSGERQAAVLAEEAETLQLAVQLIARRAQEGAATSFALLSPEPDRHYPLLDPLFRELLAPELGSVFQDLSSTPWFFGRRDALASVPMIRSALDLLRWLIQPLTSEAIDQLLLSPYLDPRLQEAAAAARKRSTAFGGPLRPGYDLASFLQMQGQGTGGALAQSLRPLLRTAERARFNGGRRTAGDWVEQCRQVLRLAGFLGARSLSAAEFTALEAWESILDALSTLDLVGGRQSFVSFWQLLAGEVQHRALSSSNTLAPLQVLSLAEAEGLCFDLAIVLGATEANLPARQSRHPLLPQELQRDLGLGSPTTDLQQALDQLDRLAIRCGTTRLLASSASAEGAEAELSPLAAALGFTTVDASMLVPQLTSTAPVALEFSPEPAALPPLASVDVPGGAEVLRLQAACGFRAFAAFRLAAGELQSSTFGLEPRQTGSVLHGALEWLWSKLESQEALRSTSMDARRTLVREAAGHALRRFRDAAGDADPWDARYLDLLETRFSSLLLAWLEEELRRAPFRIRAREDQQQLHLGPIRLQLRRDRVDEVEGGIALVDYKSSASLSSRDWLDTRPEAPQLPAYALTVEDPATLRGIAFAQVRPGEDKAGWISLSDQPGLFPRKGNRPVPVAAQLDSWRQELVSLAEAFAAGDARVNPKSFPKTCQYCGYRALCRLDPVELLEQAPEDDDDADAESQHG